MPRTENVVRMTLFPRYTALYGGSPMYTAPFRVKRFAKVILTAWSGRGLGTTAPTATVTLEQSADLGTWRPAGNVAVTDEEKSSTIALFDLEWARMKVEVVPDPGPPAQPPGTTIWAVGGFVLREGEQE